jgi:hypothetical protein
MAAGFGVGTRARLVVGWQRSALDGGANLVLFV